MRGRFKVCLVIAALAALLPATAFAQNGSIAGTVRDAQGGVMPGVTVIIRNVGTNLIKETVTGPTGAFLFPDLLAGTFDLTVSVQGFKSYEQKGIAPVARRVRGRVRRHHE